MIFAPNFIPRILRIRALAAGRARFFKNRLSKLMSIFYQMRVPICIHFSIKNQKLIKNPLRKRHAPQRRPKTCPRRPKTLPRRAKTPPRRPKMGHDASRTPPRRPRAPPRRRLNRPGRAQEAQQKEKKTEIFEAPCWTPFWI